MAAGRSGVLSPLTADIPPRCAYPARQVRAIDPQESRSNRKQGSLNAPAASSVTSFLPSPAISGTSVSLEVPASLADAAARRVADVNSKIPKLASIVAHDAHCRFGVPSDGVALAIGSVGKRRSHADRQDPSSRVASVLHEHQ
jgi:hypothetical protein